MNDLPHYQATRVAIAVVEDAGRFLVGWRAPGASLAGLAEFPGGKVHPGESPEQAVTRECREETGLEIQVGRAYPVVGHEYPQGRLELHFFHCSVATGSTNVAPTPPFRWVETAELSQLHFPEANRAVLKLLTKGQ